MLPLQQAISLLQVARDLIEAETHWGYNEDDRADLKDAAEDVGAILYTLESFGKPREPVADPCYADCVSPDVPEGYDTVLGYLAKHHPEALDLFDYSVPEATQRDGYWLAHRVKERGLEPVHVAAPPILAAQGIFQVRAYPVDLLQRRWGRP
jgi:hypothetical protein